MKSNKWGFSTFECLHTVYTFRKTNLIWFSCVVLSQVESSHKSIKFYEFLSMLLNDLYDARMLCFLNRISWISVFLTHSRKINGVISFPNLIIMLMCLMTCKCVKYQIMMADAIWFCGSNHLNVQSTKFIIMFQACFSIIGQLLNVVQSISYLLKRHL